MGQLHSSPPSSTLMSFFVRRVRELCCLKLSDKGVCGLQSQDLQASGFEQGSQMPILTAICAPVASDGCGRSACMSRKYLAKGGDGDES